MTNTNDTEKLNLRDTLIEEIKKKLMKLKEFGMSEKEITSLLQTERPPLKLCISRENRIYIGEKRVEIKMEPLTKAVYLLFLKHPEGITFKHLANYREELTRIYAQLRPNGLTDKAIQSIEDVTNPLQNSINEKCARIKAAFLGEFDDYMAKYYYIDGKRGEAKEIALPRDLVVWE